MPSDKDLYEDVQNNKVELEKLGILDDKTIRRFENYLEYGKLESITIFENYDENIRKASQYINNITGFDINVITKFVKHIFGELKTDLDDMGYIEYVKEFCKLFDDEHTLVIETDDTKTEEFTNEYINQICSYISNKRDCTLRELKNNGCHSKIYVNSDNTITKMNFTNFESHSNVINKKFLEDYFATESDINGILINLIVCGLCGTNNLSDIKEIYLVKCKIGDETHEKIVTISKNIEHNLDYLFEKKSEEITQTMYDNILKKLIKIQYHIYKNTSLIHCDLKPDNILINTNNCSDIESDNFELHIIDFGLSSINYPVTCNNINGYYNSKISSGADILFYLLWNYRYYSKNIKNYSKKWLNKMFEYVICHSKYELNKINEKEKTFNDIIIKKKSDNETKIYDAVMGESDETYANLAEVVDESIPINLWYYVSNNTD